MKDTADSFWSLPQKVKRETEKLAERGTTHPDPVVAQLAYDWAADYLAHKSRKFRLSSVIVAVLGVFVGFFTGGGLGQDFAIRRLAKQLLAIGPPKKLE
jgi:hypothetical protein